MDSFQCEQFFQIQDRFHSFYDGIIRSCSFSFGLPGKGLIFRIVISTRDKMSMGNDGWVNVVLEVNQVSEYQLRDQPKHRHQVLSNGLHFGKFNGDYFADFGSLLDEPQTIEEFRKSDWYVAGLQLSYEVAAYTTQ